MASMQPVYCFLAIHQKLREHIGASNIVESLGRCDMQNGFRQKYCCETQPSHIKDLQWEPKQATQPDLILLDISKAFPNLFWNHMYTV